MTIYSPDSDSVAPRSSRSHFLYPHPVEMIEETLHPVGDYGEARLVVKKGR
jgi:hypothetical protein